MAAGRWLIAGTHNIASFNRKTVQPITLSDGTYIPAKTLLLAPSMAISSDPEIYENPDQFDGLRYYRLRERSPQDANRHQFATVSKTMMHFGEGRHACPGRFFASHEIKMILADLVLQYDFKLKDGEGRPKNILYQSLHFPDPTKEILFKKRSV